MLLMMLYIGFILQYVPDFRIIYNYLNNLCLNIKDKTKFKHRMTYDFGIYNLKLD